MFCIAPTPITAGQTITNSLNNSLPAYYVFDATSDDVDLNVTITADAVGGVEFFADRNEQYTVSFGVFNVVTFIVSLGILPLRVICTSTLCQLVALCPHCCVCTVKVRSTLQCDPWLWVRLLALIFSR